MSFNIDNAAIKMTPSLEQEVSQATSVAAIQEILHRAAVSQHLVEHDPDERNNHFGFRPVDPGSVAAAKGFAKTLVIDGTKHIVEGATEAELASNELALMRQLFAGAPAATTEQARDAATGRFVEQPSAEEAAAIATEQARLAQLETSFRLGQISAADYIKQSGAVDSYLADQGVSVEALRDVSDQKFTQNWAAGAETFRANHPDWQGGVGNQKVIQDIILKQGWENENPVQALEAAYAMAVKEGRLVANPELVARDAIGKAQTFDEIKQAVGYHEEGSGGLWGR